MLKRLCAVVLPLLLLGAEGSASDRVFTVRSAIEMARFFRQPEVIFSPNTRYAAVVTSRGIIRSNAIESTIWIFATSGVRTFVRSPNALPPRPKVAARITEIPRAEYFNGTDETVISDLQWEPDSKRLLFLAQNPRGERQLYATDVTSGAIHALTSPGYDVKEFLYTNGAIIYDATPSAESVPFGERVNADAFDVTGMALGNILFPLTNDPSGRYNQLNYNKYNGLWIIRGGKTTRITSNTGRPLRLPNDLWPKALPLALRQISGFATASIFAPATSSKHLVVTIKQGLNIPPALWATDIETGQTKKLWDPNPQLAEMNLGQVSVLSWKDATGHEWTAGLVKPPDYIPGKRYPLVIQTHGFYADEFMGDGGYTTAFAARPLASSEILVLQMNYDSDHLGTAQEIPDQIRGFESAIALLNSSGLIDPEKVGIIGWSRMYYYVESALIQDPRLFAAAAISDGVDESYMQYLIWGDTDVHRKEAEQIYGASPFGTGLNVWMKNAPGFNLDKVQTPLKIEAITPLSILTEWETYASLKMQNKPVDLVYIPGGQHILQKPLDRLASQQGDVDWFRFWLQGYEDPDPAKAAQYKRWEGLRKLQQPPAT